MTSTPPDALVLEPPVRGDGNPLPGGVGSIVLWYLAACHRCQTDLAVPFRTPEGRDLWAAEHATATGHAVVVSIEGIEPERDHTAGVVRRCDEINGFKWLCMTGATNCRRWNGPYDSAQLALASMAAHLRAPGIPT